MVGSFCWPQSLWSRFEKLLEEYRDLLASGGSFREVERAGDELKALLYGLEERLL